MSQSQLERELLSLEKVERNHSSWMFYLLGIKFVLMFVLVGLAIFGQGLSIHTLSVLVGIVLVLGFIAFIGGTLVLLGRKSIPALVGALIIGGVCSGLVGVIPH